ncbi:MAG: hypothetical protein ACAH80_07020 [Alphaproteobacteria bacterium]
MKRPVAEAAPNTRVAAEISDAGRIALGNQMGAEVARIEGEVMQNSDSAMHVMVSEVRLKEAPSETFRMYGSGVAIINPPFPPEALDELTQYIASKLGLGAEGDVFWLDNMQINPETGMVGS